MKVLILGGQGNLGTQLTQSGPSWGHDIISWDRDDLDLSDWPLAQVKLNSLSHVEAVINTVAYNAVDAAETEPGKTMADILNHQLVANLAQWCRERGLTLIHYSSDYVFAGDKPEGYNEDDEPHPINEYGRSKRAGEVSLMVEEEQGLNYYLIRTSKLFGPRGLSPNAKPSFFDIMLQLAATSSELKGVDAEFSCFTYTPDLAQATWQLLASQADSGVYHIVNSEPTTWYGALQKLAELAHLNLPIKPISSADLPRPAARPQYSSLLMTKLPALRPYHEALVEYLQNLLDNK